MRVRTRTWFALSVLFFLAAALFWWLGERRRAEFAPTSPAATNTAGPRSSADPFFRQPGVRLSVNAPATNSFRLLSLGSDPRHPFRLSNTTQRGDALLRSETAVLLRGALIETAEGTTLPIPAHLRAGANAGSYVAQARGPIDRAFREQLTAVGAEIVSYIPNNSYLVRASADAASRLARMPRTHSVLPFEPYYKLDEELLPLAVNQKPLPAGRWLNVVAFPGQREASLRQLAALGAQVMKEQPSPFGAVFTVLPAADSLVALAQSPAVHLVEAYHERMMLTDLARERVGVSVNTVTNGNYLGLSGSNVVVGMNDSGIDTNHVELKGRIITNDASYPFYDTNDISGHGTLVAGIIVGLGTSQPPITAYGSLSNASFRGFATNAMVYSQPATYFFPNFPTGTNFLLSDYELLTNSAKTNILIDNNSWGRLIFDYDIGAAIWDAGTRDAWPEQPGMQQMLHVFAAGNEGFGSTEGDGGLPGSILSPATAKDVITVGSIESMREITNDIVTTNFIQVITTNGAGGFTTNYTNVVITNLAILFPQSDTRGQVSDFSSRGNVGIGLEGEAGRFKPDLVTPGSWVVGLRAANYFEYTNRFPWDQVDTNLGTINTNYRYASGTSVSAPMVSGMLALMQEFFRDYVNPPRTNSPALMKALLINGARSANPSYDLQVTNAINFQGWGVPYLTNSALLNSALFTGGPTGGAPYSASGSMVYMDQNVTNVLATGDSHTYTLNLDPRAVNFPLRVTLVWTDPPGNPAAGPKLVNNLDLKLVRLSNSVPVEVFEGNNFASGDDFTTPSPTNGSVADVVNNVENVYLNRPLGGSNWLIVVSGTRVNVNAVTADTNNVVQDYALVVASDRVSLGTAVEVFGPQTNTYTNRLVKQLTNQVPLFNERVGANFQLFLPNTNGNSNQWNFYVFTNSRGDVTNVVTNFTVIGEVTNMTVSTNVIPGGGSNVAIATFLPQNLARPRNRDADLDLFTTRSFVSPTASELTNLLASEVSAPTTLKSTNRGGYELITFTNGGTNEVFYIGVKSEDQQAAQFGLFLIATDNPLFQNTNGQIVLTAFPARVDVPDGSPDQPGGVVMFAVCPISTNVLSVNVTNTFVVENLGDYIGTLSHGDGQGSAYVTLLNHRTFTNVPAGSPGFPYANPTLPGGGTQFVYMSFSNYLAVPDGPGDMNAFIGQDAVGLWLFTVVDDSLEHTGYVTNLVIALNPQTNATPNQQRNIQLRPGECFLDYVDIPPIASSLNLVIQVSGGPVEVSGRTTVLLQPPGFTNDFTIGFFPGAQTTNVLWSTTSAPPISVGRHFVEFCNTNSGGTIDLIYHFEFVFDLAAGAVDHMSSRVPTNILDDAWTRSEMVNTNDRVVAGIEVSFSLLHPRPSDLAVYLVHEYQNAITKVLLVENRNGFGTNYYGSTPTMLFGTNLSLSFTEDTNKATVVVTNLAPLQQSLLTNTLPIKFGPLPLSDRISPPFFVNSNSFDLTTNRLFGQYSASAASIVGQGLFIAGTVQTNGGSVRDGLDLTYLLPLTNQIPPLLPPDQPPFAWTNWIGSLDDTNNVTVTGVTTNTYIGVSNDVFGTILAPAGTTVDRFIVGTNFVGLAFIGIQQDPSGSTYSNANVFDSIQIPNLSGVFQVWSLDAINTSTRTNSSVGIFLGAGEVFDALTVSSDADYGANINYSYPTIRWYIEHDSSGTSSFGYFGPGGGGFYHQNLLSLGTNFNCDALTWTSNDFGFGSNSFYYLRHDANGASIFGTITLTNFSAGTVADRFVVASNTRALTFAAPDLGYGPNLFYYCRDSLGSTSSVFGTIEIQPTLTNAIITDRFSTSNRIHALAFSPTNVGYGANQFYYLRDPPPVLTLVTTNYTNSPILRPRQGDVVFNGVAATSEGVFDVGQMRDYFPNPRQSSGGPEIDIYDLDTGCTEGFLVITYDFFTIPDQMTVYYGTNQLLNTGMTPGANTVTIRFGPGSSSFVRIIMNEFTGNAGTLWRYSVSVIPITQAPARNRSIVVNFPTSGPIPPPPTNFPPNAPGSNGAVWFSRALTNNIFTNYIGDDALTAVVAQNENGTNYFYGAGWAQFSSSVDHMFLVKFRTNGAGLWQVTDPPATGWTNTFATSRGLAVAADANKNIIVAGYTNDLGFGSTPYLVCYRPDGSLLWSQTLTGRRGQYNGVAAMDSSIYAVGWDNPPSPLGTISGGSAYSACIVDKWDTNGNFIARAVYDQSVYDDWLNAVVAIEGRVYAAGAYTTSSGGVDGMLLEIDPILPTTPISVSYQRKTALNVATALATDATDLYVVGDSYTTSIFLTNRDVMIFRYKIKNWYQPEESLNQFVGESALGSWRLEIWDTREGQAGLLGATQLQGWDLSFTYAPQNSAAAYLPPSYFDTRFLLNNQVLYYVVSTPLAAHFATNRVTSTKPVKVFYSPNGLPATTGPGATVLAESTTNLSLVLTTNGTPSFQPGQRYYLAVMNAGEVGTNSVTVGVNYDDTEYEIVVPELTSGVLTNRTIPRTNALDYYQFTVAPNATALFVELFPTNGNLNLLVRKSAAGSSTPLPLPAFGYFDYASANSGAATEQVFITPDSPPMPLTAGVWYVGVQNADNKAVGYGLRATQPTGAPYNVTTLASDTLVPGVTSPGNAPNTMFKLTVPSGTNKVLFEVISLSGDGDLMLKHGTYPTKAAYDLGSFHYATLPEFIVLRTNSIPGVTSLAGDWYLGVVNNQFSHITYSVQARYPTNGVLVSSTPLTATAPMPTPTTLANREFDLGLTGLDGEKYQIQYKTSLTSTTWITLTNIVAPSGGVINFIHSGALTNKALFYRIQQVP